MRNFLIFFVVLTLLQSYECGIASRKCKEYAKLVYAQVDNPTLSVTAKKENVSECGIVSVPLIVGGTQTSAKEFPHMAVIGFGLSPKSEITWECGGSLISDLYVLTAGHCMESRELGPAQKIRLGTVHLDNLDPDYQEREVAERIPHPKYKSSLKANDIALLKMDSPVKFSPYVRPACLHSADVKPGRKALASGFGKLTYEAESGSKDLMKVILSIYPHEECAKTLKLREPIIDSMLCAGHLEGGKDTCQGDSGGPLQLILKKPYCMYNVVGITSFGKFCGYANSPAIYTKVSDFIPWVESIVWAGGR